MSPIRLAEKIEIPMTSIRTFVPSDEARRRKDLYLLEKKRFTELLCEELGVPESRLTFATQLTRRWGLIVHCTGVLYD